MTVVHILHENPEWLPPFRAAFKAAGHGVEEWHLNGAEIDLSAIPPKGVYYSRMSASALTRGHGHAAATAAVLFDWLDLHGRPVANGREALRLELSKAAQHAALQAAGIATPRTVVAVGANRIEAAASRLGDAPFILKPNRGGKGLGVRLVQDLDDLRAALPALVAEPTADDVWLVQEYCPAPDQAVTRMEFIGGRLHYAVRVNTGGSFELCPAEACSVDARPMFEIQTDLGGHPLVKPLERFLARHAVDIAGVEHVVTADGRVLVYDVNINTNYNPDAEAAAGVEPGPAALARWLAAKAATAAARAA